MQRLLYILFIFSTFFLLTGCEPVSVGNSSSGYKRVPQAKVQPQEAVEFANDYLDKTFELRVKNSPLERKEGVEPIIIVTLEGDYYYIIKETYPAMSIYFYLEHAVKVHKNTGEVIPPK